MARGQQAGLHLYGWESLGSFKQGHWEHKVAFEPWLLGRSRAEASDLFRACFHAAQRSHVGLD